MENKKKLQTLPKQIVPNPPVASRLRSLKFHNTNLMIQYNAVSGFHQGEQTINSRPLLWETIGVDWRGDRAQTRGVTADKSWPETWSFRSDSVLRNVLFQANQFHASVALQSVRSHLPPPRINSGLRNQIQRMSALFLSYKYLARWDSVTTLISSEQECLFLRKFSSNW